MVDANVKNLKSRLKRKLNAISKKGNDPAFHEKIIFDGNEIALKFYKGVEGDLRDLRNLVGRTNKDYLEISESVAYLGSGILRGATARTRTLINAGNFSHNKYLVDSEKHKIEDSYQLIRVFSQMDMEDRAVISTVNEVHDIIRGLYLKLNKKSSCYIATVVYGNPFSPEVIAFKKFRDNVLMNSFLGNLFLNLYYFFSPPISRYLYDKKTFNKLIKRLILNPIYRRLQHRD